MKKFCMLLTLALLLPLVCSAFAVTASAAGEKVSFSVKARAVNEPFAGGIQVYTAENGAREVYAIENHLSGAGLLIFSADGRLIEAGSGLIEKKGACQEKAKIPAGGWMVAYDNNRDLSATRNVAMEGAMLYNATMAVIYPVKGSFDPATKEISIEYEKPSGVSDPKATHILFVGNSSTYFSGTPIQFKGLCLAAGLNVEVDYCTFGSAYLSEFADASHERGRKFRLMLNSHKYDYIFFQDAAGAELDASVKAMEVLFPLAEQNGATPVFYMRYSTYTDEVQGKQRVDHYYEIYNRLCNNYRGILAPSAYSWYVCMRKYPEINLIADDGGHHSKEGAYIIACSWLYTLFGIDPTGNAYEADLDHEVASHLQECAVISCETPYVHNSTREQKLRVGKTVYKNVAAGKSYTRTGDAMKEYTWTDHTVSGSVLGKLTDGVMAARGGENAIGATVGGDSSVVIDLEAYHAIHAIRTDLWGGNWDVGSPENASVTVSVSADGKNFTEIGKLDAEEPLKTGDWSKVNFLSEYSAGEEGASVPAGRYVKLDFHTDAGFVWTSEIGVFGEETEEPAVSEEPSEEEAPSSGMPVPAIVGIVAGVLVLAAAAVVIVLKRNKKA